MRLAETYRAAKRNEARKRGLDWRSLERSQGKKHGTIAMIGGRCYPVRLDGALAGTPFVVVLP